MKKLNLILIIISFISTSSYAQKEIGRITCEDFEMDIVVSFSESKDKTSYTYWIDALSLDRSIDNVGFMVKKEQLNRFVESLKFANEKYIQWSNIAKENNVKDLTKEIELPKKLVVGGYFTYGDWKFDYSVKPKIKFLIREGKSGLSHRLIVYSGEMIASDNEYIDCDGAALPFSNLEMMDEFLELLSEKTRNDFLIHQMNKDNLFD